MLKFWACDSVPSHTTTLSETPCGTSGGNSIKSNKMNFSIMFCRKCQSSGPKRGLGEIQVPDCKNTTLRITTLLHFNFRGA